MGHWLLTVIGVSLGLTLLIEGAYALAMGIRDKKDLLLVCLVNLLTNPAVVLIYYLADGYTGLNPIFVKALLELLAFVTEGIYYKNYAKCIRHPFWFSLSANIISLGMGLVIDKLF